MRRPAGSTPLSFLLFALFSPTLFAQECADNHQNGWGIINACEQKINTAAADLNDPSKSKKAAQDITDAAAVLDAVAPRAASVDQKFKNVDPHGMEGAFRTKINTVLQENAKAIQSARDILTPTPATAGIGGGVIKPDGKLTDNELGEVKNIAIKLEGGLNQKTAAGETVKPQQYNDVAQKFADAHDSKGAERVADKAIKADSENPGAYSIRAAARLSQGNKEGALADAEKTLSLDPNNKAAQEIVGYLHPTQDLSGKVKLGKPNFGTLPPPESILGGGAAQAQDPKLSGAASRATGEPRTNYQPARALTPSEALVRKAMGARDMHDYTKALMFATQALEADPKNAAAWALRAEISNRLKNYPAAIKDATEALILDPNNAPALRARSSAEYEQGDYQRAYADADAAVKLEPKSAVGYLYRAMAEEKLGDAKSAALDYQRAEALDLSLKPLCDDALKRLGVASDSQSQSSIKVPKRLLFRGGAIAASLILVLLGLEGGRRVATTLKRRKASRQAPIEKLPDGTIDSGTVLGGNFRVIGELGRGGMGGAWFTRPSTSPSSAAWPSNSFRKTRTPPRRISTAF